MLLVLAAIAHAQTAENTRAQNWLTLQKLRYKKSSAAWWLTAAELKQMKELQGISPFVKCTINTVRCTASALPVTGLVLKGERTNADKVILKWETQAEYNSKGFILERQSLSNSNVFDSIYYTAGAGISYSKSKYDYVDFNSYSGPSYYRVKQVDKDGNYTYSNIIVIDGAQGRLAVSIMPNPARSSNIRFYFTVPATSQTIDFTITNAIGIPLIKKDKFAAGNGYYEIKNNTFSPGYYFITVHTTTDVITKSFVIAN